jgi:hypothetical protein
MLLGMLATCALVLVGASPAHAGGSWLPFERDHYEPGEHAVASGSFGPGCCDRGWLEDGPYYAWLVPYDDTQPAEGTLLDRVVRIGEIRLSQEPYQWNGQTYFRNIATVEFVVPDLPPGQYSVFHCNDPCTKQLGDVTSAMLQVGMPPATTTTTIPTRTTTTSTTTTTTTTTTEAPDARLASAPETSTKTPTTGALVAGGAVVAAGVTAVGALRWRRRREP